MVVARGALVTSQAIPFHVTALQASLRLLTLVGRSHANFIEFSQEGLRWDLEPQAILEYHPVR